MRVYRFDRATGDFAGALDLDDGDRDPVNPDRLLIPGDATPIAPPDHAADQVARFDGERWQVCGKSAAALWAERKARAADGLALSDRIALQCFKHGVAFPPEWRAYDAAIMAIAAARDTDPVIDLPAVPAIPEFVKE